MLWYYSIQITFRGWLRLFLVIWPLQITMAPDLMKPIQYFRPKVGKGLRSNTWQRYQTILLKIRTILWPYSTKLVNPPLRPWWSLSCFQFQRTRKWSGLHPSWVSSPGSTPNVVRSERKINNLNLTNFYNISYRFHNNINGL